MRWASWAGLWLGMQLTPVPSLIRWVLSRAWARVRSGAGMFSQVLV